MKFDLPVLLGFFQIQVPLDIGKFLLLGLGDQMDLPVPPFLFGDPGFLDLGDFTLASLFDDCDISVGPKLLQRLFVLDFFLDLFCLDNFYDKIFIFIFYQ